MHHMHASSHSPLSLLISHHISLFFVKGPEMEGFYSTSLTADRALQVATDHVNSGADAPLFMYLAFQVDNTTIPFVTIVGSLPELVYDRGTSLRFEIKAGDREMNECPLRF